MTTEERYIKTKTLIGQGERVQDAIDQAGIDRTTYYKYAKKDSSRVVRADRRKNDLAPKRKYIKKSQKLVVSDLPAVTNTGKLFLVYGTAQDLAEFVRSYS